MEFEDHYVMCSLKHTMEHWLWCAVLLIEVFGEVSANFVVSVTVRILGFLDLYFY
jgi:hypothetical protein